MVLGFANLVGHVVHACQAMRHLLYALTATSHSCRGPDWTIQCSKTAADDGLWDATHAMPLGVFESPGGRAGVHSRVHIRFRCRCYCFGAVRIPVNAEVPSDAPSNEEVLCAPADVVLAEVLATARTARCVVVVRQQVLALFVLHTAVRPPVYYL